MSHPGPHDQGLGQGILRDLIWRRRFRRSCRRDIPWRTPLSGDIAWDAAQHRIAGFGDFLVAIADFEGKRWLVRERIYAGWPDPPTHVIFVFNDRGIWMARDFEFWPERWREPPQEKFAQSDAGSDDRERR